ncbi:hypothetical protein B0H99_101286 [Planomicrobium soli]|uniref:Uncharacterized protein n=1 Tax=Planomicrobium soli TaxID=1176648 RepID=A0A2P8H734_9BACL|nr:hypothetical protein [Planomicrobium soli]PSL42038.1 hypothetical protein B0H99_101286 [Planomicrobium soli]
MENTTFQELKRLNTNSAHAMGFLVAGIIALFAVGFQQQSVPAFLLAGVFTLNLILESRAYKESLKNEMIAAKQNNLMKHLSNETMNKQDKTLS